MAVRRKGERWVVEFMQRGVRVFHRLPPGTTKADAQQFESLKRRQIFNAVDLGKLPDPLLSKVIDEWLVAKVAGRKSANQTASHAKRAGEQCGGESLSSIGVAAAKIAADDHLSAATRNRRLCILKAVAKYAFQKGYTQENLSPKIQLLPENNARHVYITQAQVDSLIVAAPTDEAKAFIALAAYTGMRQGEILALTQQDIGPAGLVVRDSKIGEPRVVPYVGNPRYLRSIPFTSHKRTLYAAFETARDSLGLHGLRYHDLRHTTASLLINSGVDLYTVGRILGHKSAQTTQRYAHLSVEMQRAALNKAFNNDKSRKTGRVPQAARGTGAAKKARSRLDGKAGIKGKGGRAGKALASPEPREAAGTRRGRAGNQGGGA